MIKNLLVVLLLIGPATPALAQQKDPADTASAHCLLAGKTFSAGATIRASSGVDLCGPDGTWTATDKPAAGCFLADNLYATGAEIALASSKTLVDICGGDGTWTVGPVKEAP